jgi:hypothetical protein
MEGTRRPGKGQNMEIHDKNMNSSEMYTNATNHQTWINIRYFWMKLGAY